MIACNSCPTRDGCKEYGQCLNAKVVQLSQVRIDYHPDLPEHMRTYYEERAAIKPEAWDKIWKGPECWHQYPLAEPSLGLVVKIITVRTCIHCRQPEF